MGALMSSADGRPTLKYRAMQTLLLTFAVFGGLEYNDICAVYAGMDGPNSLLDLATGLFTGGVAVGLFLLESARVALQPDGALQALCEHVKPSDSESVARTVQRWRVALGVFSASFMLLGGWQLIAGFRALFRLPGLWMAWFELFLVGLSFIIVFPVLISGWWASMSIGSCLCRDAVNDVIAKAKVTDPAAEDGSEWHAGVAAPALALRKTLNLLSDGWSRGMVALGGWMWLCAIAAFAMAVNKTYTDGYDHTFGHRPDRARDTWFVIAATFAAVPMLLALDLAVTGQRCHKLMFELNEAGIRHGEAHPMVQPQSIVGWLSIDWLIRSLKRLNKGNGLGFAFGPLRTVIDLKTLGKITLLLFVPITTVFSYMVGMSDDANGANATAAQG